jgi:hypothetical protein
MPDRQDKAALLEGWLELDPDRQGATIEDSIDAAGDAARYPTLRAALLSISRDSKLPSVDKLKYKLRSMKKTPINHMRLETCGKKNLAALWRVVAC